MKTMHEIEDMLRSFEMEFGFEVSNAEQGSGTWLQMKLGVISASNASRAVAKKDSQTRATYLYTLVGQVLTGVAEEINSKYLDYGAEHEGPAKALYSLHTKEKIQEVPFIFKDETYRCGASPDGIIESQHGLELKVPYTPVEYVKFLCADKIDSDYVWQVQFSMWCSGAESWDFAMFSPTAKAKPIKIVSVKKDPDMQKKLDDSIPEFVADMDTCLKTIGIEFGDQWRRLSNVK